MTGPLANEFAQMREALMRSMSVTDPFLYPHEVYDEGMAALARIEEHTHNTEKALRAIAGYEHPLGMSTRDSFDRTREIARDALSAGKGAPA